jgi:hypothetical protein
MQRTERGKTKRRRIKAVHSREFEEIARRRSYIKRRGSKNCESETFLRAKLEPVEPAEYADKFFTPVPMLLFAVW